MEMENKISYGKMNNYNPQEARTFFEKINSSYLKTIVKNFDKVYPKIGKIKDKSKGFVEITDREQIRTLFKNRIKNIVHKFTYKRPRNNKDGRIFSDNWSLCGMNKIIRHTLAKEFNYDIDIVNAHPSFLVWYCDINNINCKYLKQYCDNRNEFLNNYADQMNTQPEIVKTTILSLINDQNREYEPQHPLYDFYEEMKKIQDRVCILNKSLATKCKKNNIHNPKGSCMSYFLQNIENKILSVMIDFCISKEIGLSAPCFDGFLAYKDDCDNYGLENLLSDLEKYVFETLDIQIKLSEKSMNKDIINFLEDLDETSTSTTSISSASIDIDDIPDIDLPHIEEDGYYFNDFYKERNKVFDSLPDLMSFFKQRFPLVCHRINAGKGFYIKKDTETDLYTPIGLKDLDSLKFYYKSKNKKTGEEEECTTSVAYLMDKCKIETYAEIVSEPRKDVIHKGKFNIWTPFKADKQDIKYDENYVKPMLDYILEILATNNEDIFKYIISWVRHICKYPEKKTGKILVFQSNKQRAGKGTFVNWLHSYIFGGTHSYTTSFDKLTRGFNSFLINKSFILIDELPSTSKTFHALFDKVKNMSTEPTLDIEYKGREPFSVNNICNYVFTTNNEKSVKIEEYDGRYAIIKINESKVGDHEFWTRMYKEVFTEEMAYQFFHYLVNMDDDDDRLTSIQILPVTQLKTDLIELNLSSMQTFLNSMRKREFDFDMKVELIDGTSMIIDDIPIDEDICIKYNIFYDLYKVWCDNNGETRQKPRNFNFFTDVLTKERKEDYRYFCVKSISPKIENSEN
jgi:hypothetical protein